MPKVTKAIAGDKRQRFPTGGWQNKHMPPPPLSGATDGRRIPGAPAKKAADRDLQCRRPPAHPAAAPPASKYLASRRPRKPPRLSVSKESNGCGGGCPNNCGTRFYKLTNPERSWVLESEPHK